MKMQQEYPIDFVIYWVDGNDLEWQVNKQKYLTKSGESDEENVGTRRYRDWDNLRFWFRSVEKYAPWVHRIFFVTCGHVPEWLDGAHEKLQIVRHDEFIPQEYLPTFSANPIENNLHRIPGLSEHFVVFNDDFFVTSKVLPTDFFVDGIPVDMLIEFPVFYGGSSSMPHIITNDMSLIAKYYSRKEIKRNLRSKLLSFKYGKYFFYELMLYIMPFQRIFGFSNFHFARPYLKSSFEQLWKKEEKVLDATCRHRFRSEEDVNIYVFRLWNLLKGNFVPRNIYKQGKAFFCADSVTEVCRAIEQKEYKLICINDECTDEDFEQFKAQIIKAFSTVLPEKSSYEKE